MKRLPNQKDGLSRVPSDIHLGWLDMVQEKFQQVGLPQAYAAAMHHKYEARTEAHRRSLTPIRGLRVGDAMLRAIDRDDDQLLIPYATMKTTAAKAVMRLHVIDSSSELALPESGVKVADCDPRLTTASAHVVNGFSGDQFQLLRQTHTVLTERGLYGRLTKD